MKPQESLRCLLEWTGVISDQCVFRVPGSNMCTFLIYQIKVILTFIVLVCCIKPQVMPNLDLLNVKPKIENLNKISLKGKPVPPCIACQSLVKSFLAAVKKTTRQSFSGGDADWEKQKLGAYENSELRFIEIQEMLCIDVELGKEQCYNLAEEYESELEDWFYKKRKQNVDLFESLCINHIKVCCPNNTYGPNCIPCPGGTEKPCGGHGKCRKGGTREEPANCVCDTGYTGELCMECDKGFYPEPSTSLSCKKCDISCKSHCRGPGPKNCEVCAHGYHFIPDKGCVELSQQSEAGDSSKQELKQLEMSDNDEKSKDNSSDNFSNNDDHLHLKSSIEDSTISTGHSEL